MTHKCVIRPQKVNKDSKWEHIIPYLGYFLETLPWGAVDSESLVPRRTHGTPEHHGSAAGPADTLLVVDREHIVGLLRGPWDQGRRWQKAAEVGHQGWRRTAPYWVGGALGVYVPWCSQLRILNRLPGERNQGKDTYSRDSEITTSCIIYSLYLRRDSSATNYLRLGDTS